MVELVGDLGQGMAGHPFSLSIGVEEAQYPFGLLEGFESIRSVGSDRNIDIRT